MRSIPLASLLTGCAVLALAAPAGAQQTPIMRPPLIRPAPVTPATAPAVGADVADPLVLPETSVEDQPSADAVADANVPPATVAPPIPAEWSPVPVDPAGQSAYGLYLAGRLASIRG